MDAATLKSKLAAVKKIHEAREARRKANNPEYTPYDAQETATTDLAEALVEAVADCHEMLSALCRKAGIR